MKKPISKPASAKSSSKKADSKRSYKSPSVKKDQALAKVTGAFKITGPAA